MTVEQQKPEQQAEAKPNQEREEAPVFELQKKFTVTDEDMDQLFEVLKKFHSSNVWSKVKREDLKVKRFPLGFVNNIMCCEMTDEARQRLCTHSSDCPAIVVKFLIGNTFLETDRAEQAMVVAIVSAMKLSPRLLLVTESGYINEYFDKSDNYSREDDLNPKTLRLLAKKLAQFHSLDVPLSRLVSDQWKLFETQTLDESPWGLAFQQKAYLKLFDKHPELKQKSYYQQIKEFDPVAPSNEVRHFNSQIESPTVFCHNDFNRGNILVRNKTKTGNDDEEKEIVLLDFDYSSLNKRSRDLGRFFSNFCHHDPMFGNEGFPTDKEMVPFLETYRSEYAQFIEDKSDREQFLRDERNSVEQLIRESKISTMDAYFLDSMFGLGMVCMDPNVTADGADRFLQIFGKRYSGYCELRDRFLADKTIVALPSKLALTSSS